MKVLTDLAAIGLRTYGLFRAVGNVSTKLVNNLLPEIRKVLHNNLLSKGYEYYGVSDNGYATYKAQMGKK